ncbi:MAG: HNH endonuclease [Chloroflexi bacterium]|nr:HNH endonuclease [Chloroflexota bacterium]
MKQPYLQCWGEAWEEARMRALVRDNFTCQAHVLGLCDEPCTENRLRRLHVHHIQERQAGVTHDLENLITLCRNHHIQLHPHMRYQYAMRNRVLEAGPAKEL